MEEDRDSYEGHKLSTRYDCVFCWGAGVIKDTDVRYKAVESYIDVLVAEHALRAQRVKDEQEKIRKVRSKALAKLTKAEIEALGVKDES